MLRTLSHASRWLAAAALVAAPAITMAQADNRPVVVVFTFTNSSIGAGHADFEGISTGVQDLLITDLASNAKVRLVDRAKIGEILAEQKMVKDGQVDGATAVRLGKIMGAQYAISGGFISDGKGKAVLTAHTIDIETTQIGTPQKIEGKADDVLGLIAQLSSKLTSGMNLAPHQGGPRPIRPPTGDSTAGPKGPGVETYAKATSQTVVDKTNKVKLDIASMKAYSSALDEMDKKNNTKAKTLLTQVVAKYPDFQPAKDNLAKINGSAGN